MVGRDYGKREIEIGICLMGRVSVLHDRKESSGDCKVRCIYLTLLNLTFENIQIVHFRFFVLIYIYTIEFNF